MSNKIMEQTTKLNAENKAKVIQMIKSKFEDKPWSATKPELDFDEEWLIHEGDLIVNESYYSEYNLIVTGNLTINGSFYDFESSLVVVGDMNVKHLLSEYTLLILGNLNAKGLVFNYYNDYSFECVGDVNCRVYYIQDRSCCVWGKVKADYSYDYDRNGINEYADKFVDKVICFDDDKRLDFANVTYLASENKPIFKDEIS